MKRTRKHVEPLIGWREVELDESSPFSRAFALVYEDENGEDAMYEVHCNDYRRCYQVPGSDGSITSFDSLERAKAACEDRLAASQAVVAAFLKRVEAERERAAKQAERAQVREEKQLLRQLQRRHGTASSAFGKRHSLRR